MHNVDLRFNFAHSFLSQSSLISAATINYQHACTNFRTTNWIKLAWLLPYVSYSKYDGKKWTETFNFWLMIVRQTCQTLIHVHRLDKNLESCRKPFTSPWVSSPFFTDHLRRDNHFKPVNFILISTCPPLPENLIQFKWA